MATIEKPLSGSIPFAIAMTGLIAAIILAIILSAGNNALKIDIHELEYRVHRLSSVLSAMGLVPDFDEFTGLSDFTWEPGDSRSEIQAALDQSKVAAAMGHLRDIQRSLVMHLMESFRPEFPPTEEINTFENLQEILSDYLPRSLDNAAPPWVFLSYYRKSPQEFLLVMEARDSQQTLITVTQDQITPWYIDMQKP